MSDLLMIADAPPVRVLTPPEVTIVMPCLNEAETLGVCIEKAQSGLHAAGVAGEIIVADNGSDDGSQDIAHQHGARVIHVTRRGYGAALRAGIAAAHGRYVIMADSDASYDFSILSPFIEKLRAGYAFVCGTRIKGTIMPDAMPWLHRWIGNPVLTGLGNFLFHTHLSDYHCGMRGFDRQAILNLGLCTPGMEFATEMIAKAALHELTITEVPIVYCPDGRSRAPHLRTWHDGWRHLRFMLLLSPAWVFLYPGLALLVLGLTGMFVLLPGPLQIGTIGLDVHTLLVCGVGAIIGVQVLTFWLSARLFASNIGLLPMPHALFRIVRGAPLGTGLALGGILFVLGMIPTIQAFHLWTEAQFHDLDYRVALRWLIPGLVLLAIGIHVFFASFIVSLINFTENWTIRQEEQAQIDEEVAEQS
ncbi:MAG: glycosyltransferase family 2 protein [Aggregatilineales bacterium]